MDTGLKNLGLIYGFTTYIACVIGERPLWF